jgi:SAM-dependent methyltransferase
MQQKIVTILSELNQRFYREFAEAFSTSRARTEPGIERILSRIAPGQRVLDLGCGPGRLAALLPSTASYVGVDYAPEILDVARARLETQATPTRFIQADLVTDAWESDVPAPFDWIILRAVLHHIPGYDNRLDIVRRAARVLAPQGRILLANWQFLKIERLRRRLLPWETIDLTDEDVESGDYLLDWRRQGRALRYVHLVDEAETLKLITDAGLQVEDLYYADGHTDDLTLYALAGKQLQRPTT